MKKALVVIDMQNDFITGTLGSPAGQRIVPAVVRKIRAHRAEGSDIIFTRDTHAENYLETEEGRNLPVVHCVKGTQGWQIAEDMLDAARGYSYKVIDKPTFGSVELAQYLAGHAPWDEIEIVGLVSSICVASNALIIKAYLPETRIAVDASCTAGVTEDDGKAALTVMKMCHIDVRNEAAP